MTNISLSNTFTPVQAPVEQVSVEDKSIHLLRNVGEFLFGTESMLKQARSGDIGGLALSMGLLFLPVGRIFKVAKVLGEPGLRAIERQALKRGAQKGVTNAEKKALTQTLEKVHYVRKSINNPDVMNNVNFEEGIPHRPQEGFKSVDRKPSIPRQEEFTAVEEFKVVDSKPSIPTQKELNAPKKRARGGRESTMELEDVDANKLNKYYKEEDDQILQDEIDKAIRGMTNEDEIQQVTLKIKQQNDLRKYGMSDIVGGRVDKNGNYIPYHYLPQPKLSNLDRPIKFKESTAPEPREPFTPYLTKEAMEKMPDSVRAEYDTITQRISDIKRVISAGIKSGSGTLGIGKHLGDELDLLEWKLQVVKNVPEEVWKKYFGLLDNLSSEADVVARKNLLKKTSVLERKIKNTITVNEEIPLIGKSGGRETVSLEDAPNVFEQENIRLQDYYGKFQFSPETNRFIKNITKNLDYEEIPSLMYRDTVFDFMDSLLSREIIPATVQKEIDRNPMEFLKAVRSTAKRKTSLRSRAERTRKTGIEIKTSPESGINLSYASKTRYALLQELKLMKANKDKYDHLAFIEKENNIKALERAMIRRYRKDWPNTSPEDRKEIIKKVKDFLISKNDETKVEPAKVMKNLPSSNPSKSKVSTESTATPSDKSSSESVKNILSNDTVIESSKSTTSSGKPKEVFVFGSNLAGRHGAGAAKFAAEHHGAQYGKGVGIQGSSYAIPTKGHNLEVLSLDEIAKHVDDFIAFAKKHSDVKFNLTAIGTGLSKHDPKEIAKLFKELPDNVHLMDEPNGAPNKLKKFIDELKKESTTTTSEETTVARWNRLTTAEQKDAVYVGRAQGDRGMFGNPYTVGGNRSVKDAVDSYEHDLLEIVKHGKISENNQIANMLKSRGVTIEKFIDELRKLKGKRLACPGGEPNEECHANSLIRAINYLHNKEKGK